MQFDYTRVSTRDQPHDLQAAGCERVYTDTCSGSVADADHLQLRKM
jgi:DNA invertase Pin-like site-specific DNA recombinase